MNEQDVLLQVICNRGWLSPALIAALVDDPQFSGLEELLALEQSGVLLRHQLPGLLLFRAAYKLGPG